MTPKDILRLLYVMLTIDALFNAIPAALNWWRQRRSWEFKYFALRAGLTALASVMEAVSLIILLVFDGATSVWIVLCVWQIGELMKVVGEWGLTGSLFSVLNGHRPTDVYETVSVDKPPVPPTLPPAGGDDVA